LLTVQSVQLLTWQGRTLTWQGRTLMWQVLSWQTVGSCEVKSFLDTWHIFDKWDGATWPRHGLPHGTVFNLVWLLKLYGVHGDRTPDLPPWWSAFTRCGLPIAHALFLIIYMVLFIFKFELCYGLGAVRAGAKPQPPFICGSPYDHTACVSNGFKAPRLDTCRLPIRLGT
jgi:hypothetical protein